MKTRITAIFFALAIVIAMTGLSVAFAEPSAPQKQAPTLDERYQRLAMHYSMHIVPKVGDAGVNNLHAAVARYPFMGIGIILAPNTPDDPRTVIAEVWKDSPALAAGLRAEDRIVAVNGQASSCGDSPYECLASVSTSIREAPDTFKIEVLRGDEKLAFTLTKAMIGAEIPQLAVGHMAEWGDYIRAQENAARAFVAKMVASVGNSDELDKRFAELKALDETVSKPFDELQEIENLFLVRP